MSTAFPYFTEKIYGSVNFYGEKFRNSFIVLQYQAIDIISISSAFIFLIVVVMMNLLNGLAVSDTGVIRQEAEIHAYKSQVGIVSYMESMMLGDPFNFLANWPKFIWLKHIPTCSLVILPK